MSCVNCNKFYGNPETENLCSSCYKKIHPEIIEKQLKLEQEKKQFKEKWNNFITSENIIELINLYNNITPYPEDIMEAMLRDCFNEYVLQNKLLPCQLLLQNEKINEIIKRMSFDILSKFINRLRHSYGSKPSNSVLEMFDFLANIPEFKNRLTEQDLITSLCIHHATDIVEKMINVSKEGVFEITKESLENAMYLNKRPHNVPSEEKKRNILLIKNAIEDQKKRKKLQSSSTTIEVSKSNKLQNNDEDEVEDDVKDTSIQPETILETFCFALTGEFSVDQLELTNYLKEHGARIVKSITKTCTHLIW